MKRGVVGSIVQAYVFEVVVTCFTSIFEHCRLKYRHTDCAHNARLRFASMNDLGFNMIEALGQLYFTHLNYRNLLATEL